MCKVFGGGTGTGVCGTQNPLPTAATVYVLKERTCAINGMVRDRLEFLEQTTLRGYLPTGSLSDIYPAAFFRPNGFCRHNTSLVVLGVLRFVWMVLVGYYIQTVVSYLKN